MAQIPPTKIAPVLASLLHLQETKLEGDQCCGRCNFGLSDFDWNMDFLCNCTPSSWDKQSSNRLVARLWFRRLAPNRWLELWSVRKRRNYNRDSRQLGSALEYYVAEFRAVNQRW